MRVEKCAKHVKSEKQNMFLISTSFENILLKNKLRSIIMSYIK